MMDRIGVVRAGDQEMGTANPKETEKREREQPGGSSIILCNVSSQGHT